MTFLCDGMTAATSGADADNRRPRSWEGTGPRPSGIIGSILGAVVLLAAWRAIRPTPRQRTS
jgi:hypothetical protein